MPKTIVRGTAQSEVIDLSLLGGTEYVATGRDGNDTITGGDFDDTLRGGKGDDTLFGAGGNDRLIDDAGSDTAYGGAGDDVFRYAGDTLVADGGADFDTFVFDRSAAVTVNLATGIHAQGAAGLTVTGFEAFRLSGQADVFTSGAAAVNLKTYDGADVVVLKEGNDRVDLGAGNDSVDAGAGDDIIVTGAGTDTVYGGAGNDRIVSQGDANEIYGGADNDLVIANVTPGTFDTVPGIDVVTSGSTPVSALTIMGTLHGGTGVDTLSFKNATGSVVVPSPGQASYVGAELSGFEIILGSDFADVIIGGLATNTLYGRGGNDVLSIWTPDTGTQGSNSAAFGGDGNDVLIGSGLMHLLNGGVGNDTLSALDGSGVHFGKSGDDVFLVDQQSDVTLHGGGGTDTIDFSGDWSATVAAGITTGVIYDMTTGLGFRLGAAGFISTSIEAVIGTDYADQIVVSATGTVSGGDGNDLITAVEGAGVVSGGAGIDTLSFEGYGAGVQVNLGVTFPQGWGEPLPLVLAATDFENLRGTDYADTLTGVTGMANTLYGGKGDDTFVMTDLLDVMDGGEGFDTVDFSNIQSATEFWFNSSSAGFATTYAGIESFVGLNAQVNHVQVANTDVSRVEGGAFGDTLSVSDADGGTIVGNDGNDTIQFGNATGSGPGWTIDAGTGNDTLIGDTWDAVVTLGAGADEVHLLLNPAFAVPLGLPDGSSDLSANNVEAVYITDFVSGEDKLNVILTGIKLDGGAPLEGVNFFKDSAYSSGLIPFDETSGGILIYDTLTGALSYDANSNDAALYLLATLNGAPPLELTDFIGLSGSGGPIVPGA